MRRYNPNIKPSSSSNDIVLLKLEFEFELEFEFNVNGIEFEKRVIGAVSLSLLLSQTQRQHQCALVSYQTKKLLKTVPKQINALKPFPQQNGFRVKLAKTIYTAYWFSE
jgi:hypothetical protein